MKIREIIKNGKKGWLVDLGQFKNGKRERLLFRSKKKAEKFLKAKETELERDGTGAVSIPTVDAPIWQVIKNYCTEKNIDPLELVAFHKANAKEMIFKTLGEAVDDFKVHKTAMGKRKPYLHSMKSIVTSFATGRRALACSNVTQQMIEEWARTPAKRKTRLREEGSIAKPGTINARVGFLKVFFQYCVKRKFRHDDPTAHIERIAIEDRPPSIHSIPDAKRLLRACLTHPKGELVLWHVVLVYFGGLRPTEAYWLDAYDIKESLIEVSSYKSKTRRRRFVTINDTLKAWIKHPKFKLYRKNLYRNICEVRASLENFPWDHDVLRHSFCSYSLPIYGATKTAEQAGHSERMLFAHYRERVKLEDAQEFWRLTPENVIKEPIDAKTGT